MATDFDNYYVYRGHTFKIFKTRLAWKDAKADCESRGGHLAKIDSQDIQDFIKTFVENPAWIGGYRDVVEATWKWVTGEKWTSASYTNWDSGRPDGGPSYGGKPYVQIGVGNNFTQGKWTNGSDSATAYYICEWELDLLGESTYSGPALDSEDIEALYSIPVKPFIFRGKLHPADEEMVECRFVDDRFSPDFEISPRAATIPLLKGTAIQINRPSSALHILSVGNGLFLSKKDYILFTQLYHSNLIGEPEPSPIEFLTLREEDYELELPDGYIFNVAFAEAPVMQPQRMSRGNWLYTLQCKFRIVPDTDEQEEL